MNHISFSTQFSPKISKLTKQKPFFLDILCMLFSYSFHSLNCLFDVENLNQNSKKSLIMANVTATADTQNICFYSSRTELVSSSWFQVHGDVGRVTSPSHIQVVSFVDHINCLRSINVFMEMNLRRCIFANFGHLESSSCKCFRSSKGNKVCSTIFTMATNRRKKRCSPQC